MDVEKQNIGFPLASLGQDLKAIVCGFDIETHSGAAVGNGSENAGIVVGNEDLWRFPI
jgi:hypothetical protein